MYDVLAEVAGELVASIVFGAVALVITGVGLLAEVTGAQELSAGHTVTALWLVAFGGVVLYVGAYMLGYRTVLARGA
ncbi:MAG: hypothetical protein ABEJ68_02735 [Halobacteriaceae archaeon]